MSYRRGANFEREVKKRLEAESFFVVRSAGSRTAIDLLAIRKHSQPMLIQCKKNGIIKESEVWRLRDLATVTGGVPIFAFKDHEGVKFKKLNSGEAPKPHLNQKDLSAF